jgi:hypothetical protein
MHDEINDAHVYEIKNAICGSQTPGVLHILLDQPILEGHALQQTLFSRKFNVDDG